MVETRLDVYRSVALRFLLTIVDYESLDVNLIALIEMSTSFLVVDFPESFTFVENIFCLNRLTRRQNVLSSKTTFNKTVSCSSFWSLKLIKTTTSDNTSFHNYLSLCMDAANCKDVRIDKSPQKRRDFHFKKRRAWILIDAAIGSFSERLIT